MMRVLSVMLGTVAAVQLESQSESGVSQNPDGEAVTTEHVDDHGHMIEEMLHRSLYQVYGIFDYLAQLHAMETTLDGADHQFEHAKNLVDEAREKEAKFEGKLKKQRANFDKFVAKLKDLQKRRGKKEQKVEKTRAKLGKAIETLTKREAELAQYTKQRGILDFVNRQDEDLSNHKIKRCEFMGNMFNEIKEMGHSHHQCGHMTCTELCQEGIDLINKHMEGVCPGLGNFQCGEIS